MIEHKLIKVEEDSPNRCQSVGKFGQCPFAKVEGFSYCARHAASGPTRMAEEKSRNYKFLKYSQRINEKADNDSVKSLREEVGILRMCMEETINMCKDDTDIMIYSPKIADLAMKIEKIVVSCHRLETSLGHTLDKTKILNIATQIVNIITEHVSDEALVNMIVKDIGKLMSE